MSSRDPYEDMPIDPFDVELAKLMAGIVALGLALMLVAVGILVWRHVLP